MAWAREQFGRNADRMFRSLRQELGIVVEKTFVFSPGRRGRSTRYRIGRERISVVAA